MRYAIALDIGGTKIEVALIDSKYRSLKRVRIKTPAHANRKDFLNMLTSIIDNLADRNIEGIGISFPANILPGGRIAGVSKIGCLSGYNLKAYLKRKYKCKVMVENDADCFAYAESMLGSSRNTMNSFGLIWGTGIGGGIIIGKKIYKGRWGSAGEIGHDVKDPKGPLNVHGKRGDIESYAGGEFIVKNYVRTGGKMDDPTPARIFASKEKTAKKIFEDAIDAVARALSYVQNNIDPEIIVIGGGISNLPIIKKLEKKTKRYTYKNMASHVRIRRNSLGDDAGIYGAAALVFGH